MSDRLGSTTRDNAVSGNYAISFTPWGGTTAYSVFYFSPSEAQAIRTSNATPCTLWPNERSVRDFMEVLRIDSAMEGTALRTATIYSATINTKLLSTMSHSGTAKASACLRGLAGHVIKRMAIALKIVWIGHGGPPPAP